MVDMRVLGEVSDSEMEADPLVVLPCGHAFLMSTADGFMNLAAFYSSNASGRWVHHVLKWPVFHVTLD
jgi:hypothetical protein